MAGRLGFTKVDVLDAVGKVGQYTNVQVIFR